MHFSWLVLIACTAYLSILDSSRCNADCCTWFPGLETTHLTGSRLDNTSWAVDVDEPSETYLTYGPYVTGLDTAVTWLVEFYLSIDNNDYDDLVVLELDVHDYSTDQVLTSMNIHRNDFETVSQPQLFTLFFTNYNPNASMEFRVFYACCSYIIHYQTSIRIMDEGPFGSFWHDASHFELISTATFPSPGAPVSMNVGFYFVVQNDIWYLFHREYGFATQPSYCTADYARIVLVTSSDNGQTWSNETVLVSPQPNTPWECAIVDGTAFFDAELDQWMYLGQCLARDEVWNMCLFTRQGDPFGPFTPFDQNPVVKSGQLWGAICAGPSKHCTTGMGEEGTPDLVKKDDQGFYYVTFHGWDPAHLASGRGVAKTQNWVDWVTAGEQLPGDSMFSSLDCNAWNISWAKGGCVGGGEGSILISGDFYYQLIEAPDLTLGCEQTQGEQNWVLGLLRAPTTQFLPSGVWQQLAPFANSVQSPVSNPVVVPVVKIGCYIQYHRLFTDTATDNIFLEVWVGVGDQGSMQVFQLVDGAGPLPMVVSADSLL